MRTCCQYWSLEVQNITKSSLGGPGVPTRWPKSALWVSKWASGGHFGHPRSSTWGPWRSFWPPMVSHWSPLGSPRDNYGCKNRYLGGSLEQLGSTASPMYTFWKILAHFGNVFRQLLMTCKVTFAHMLSARTILKKITHKSNKKWNTNGFQTVFSWNVDASEMRTCDNYVVITDVFWRSTFSNNT